MPAGDATTHTDPRRGVLRHAMFRRLRLATAALPLAAIVPLASAAHAAPAEVLLAPAVVPASLTDKPGPVPRLPLSLADAQRRAFDRSDATALPTSLVVETGWTLPVAEQAARLAPLGPAPAPSTAAYGPAAPQEASAGAAGPRFSFGDRLDAVKWETLGLAAYLTAINLPGLLKNPSDFDFEREGLFGKDTANLGMDKVAHAYNAYVLSDVLYARMKRKTGASSDGALASAAIALGLDVYAELFDAFEERSGFSFGDVGFNVLGTGFSYLRNTVPGLREKLDFRLLLIPNRDIYSIDNKKEHFRQERFLFALKLAGFAPLERSPLRFVELHAGYYARGFTDRERARGAARERKPFVGVGINLAELLFPSSRSTVARVARTGLEYLQVPYTAVHID